jgi:hypothetical protein
VRGTRRFREGPFCSALSHTHIPLAPGVAPARQVAREVEVVDEQSPALVPVDITLNKKKYRTPKPRGRFRASYNGNSGTAQHGGVLPVGIRRRRKKGGGIFGHL